MRGIPLRSKIGDRPRFYSCHVIDLVPVTRRFFKTTKNQIVDRIKRYSVSAEDLPTSWSFIAEHIKAGISSRTAKEHFQTSVRKDNRAKLREEQDGTLQTATTTLKPRFLKVHGNILLPIEVFPGLRWSLAATSRNLCEQIIKAV